MATAQVQIMNDTQLSVDALGTSVAFLLEFSKTSDSMSHYLLWRKLRIVGFLGFSVLAGVNSGLCCVDFR
jgi:hypothetical protein